MLKSPYFFFPVESKCNDWDLQVTQSSSSVLGVLEVCSEGSWRRLIVTSWYDSDANVACKQLGFSSGGQSCTRGVGTSCSLCTSI